MRDLLRKIFVILLLTLSMLLASCGGTDGGEPSDGNDSATVTDEQGLIYTLKDDGSYSVGAEKDITVKELVIPESIVSNRFDVNISHTIITEELIKRFHDEGLKVTCYTVDNPSRAEELAMLGVDYMLTNKLE